MELTIMIFKVSWSFYKRYCEFCWNNLNWICNINHKPGESIRCRTPNIYRKDQIIFGSTGSIFGEIFLTQFLKIKLKSLYLTASPVVAWTHETVQPFKSTSEGINPILPKFLLP